MNLDRVIKYSKITVGVVSTLSTIERAAKYGGRAYQYMAPYIPAAVETAGSDVSSFFTTLVKSKITASVIGMALGNYAISKIPMLKGDPGGAFMFTAITATSVAAFGPSILLPSATAYVAGRCITHEYGLPARAPSDLESLLALGSLVCGVATFGPLAIIPYFNFAIGRGLRERE